MPAAKAKSVSLEVVGKEGDRQLAFAQHPGVPLHNQYHRNAMLSTAQAACWIVLAGFELQKVKKSLPHGQWQNWVADNCEYSADSAQRYMAVAEGVKDKALKEAKTAPVRFLALLEKPASSLTTDEQVALLKSVHKLTEGETIKQLYLDFGILKKPKKGHGGNNGGGGTDPSQDTDEAAAIDLWTPILKGLALEGLKERSWVHLPDKGEISRDTLSGLLTDLATQLREAKPTRPGGRVSPRAGATR